MLLEAHPGIKKSGTGEPRTRPSQWITQIERLNNTEIEPSRLVAQLKGYTSRELLRLFPRLRRRWGAPVLWSKSNFCESVGHISQDTVQRYIELQKQR